MAWNGTAAQPIQKNAPGRFASSGRGGPARWGRGARASPQGTAAELAARRDGEKANRTYCLLVSRTHSGQVGFALKDTQSGPPIPPCSTFAETNQTLSWTLEVALQCLGTPRATRRGSTPFLVGGSGGFRSSAAARLQSPRQRWPCRPRPPRKWPPQRRSRARRASSERAPRRFPSTSRTPAHRPETRTSPS